MAKKPRFYAAGFVFNSRTDKVLLRKKEDTTEFNPFIWTLFGGLSKRGETPLKTFQREVSEVLKLRIPKNAISLVYDYLNDDFNMQRHVFVANSQAIKSIKRKLKAESEDYAWVPLEEALKLSLSKRARQDLIFFQREVKAKQRQGRQEKSSEVQEVFGTTPVPLYE